MIAEIICAVSLTCTLANEVDMPFRYVGKPYDTSKSCYVKGEFFKRCPALIDVYDKARIQTRATDMDRATARQTNCETTKDTYIKLCTTLN